MDSQPERCIVQMHQQATGTRWPTLPRSIYALLGDIEVATRLMRGASVVHGSASHNDHGQCDGAISDLSGARTAQRGLVQQLFALNVAQGVLSLHAPDDPIAERAACNQGAEPGALQVEPPSVYRPPSQICDDG